MALACQIISVENSQLFNLFNKSHRWLHSNWMNLTRIKANGLEWRSLYLGTRPRVCKCVRVCVRTLTHAGALSKIPCSVGRLLLTLLRPLKDSEGSWRIPQHTHTHAEGWHPESNIWRHYQNPFTLLPSGSVWKSHPNRSSFSHRWVGFFADSLGILTQIPGILKDRLTLEIRIKSQGTVCKWFHGKPTVISHRLICMGAKYLFLFCS